MKKIKIGSNKELLCGKIVCVGRNYAAHARELGNEVPEFPIIFLKPPSNLISGNEKIEYQPHSKQMHHEVELVLLIGKTLKNANIKEAEDAIIGYAVGLDMTLRDLQSKCKSKGQPWTLAKCFDTSAVVSDFILKTDYKLKGNETIKIFVNDELRQNSTLDKMIFSPAEVVKYISEKMSLEEGDLIFTGTPEGVGEVFPKDKLTAEIENIGSFTTEVISH